MTMKRDVVTGAFSYTGQYITRLLLDEGHEVSTLTARSAKDGPFGDAVVARPFNFAQPPLLISNLDGVDTLYNTYWVRFSHGDVNFDEAVRNTKILISASKSAGVKRFIHVSITNPTEDSHLPYFRGKAVLEKFLIESGLSYGIVRPTVLFGHGDVFINNIAWVLRHFPFFGIPGDGQYGIQPVHVEDVAELCVGLGQASVSDVVDAAGPEIFTFEEFVGRIARALGKRRPTIRLPPWAAFQLARFVGLLVNDVVMNGEELEGLMANLVVSRSAATGRRDFTSWLEENKDTLGRTYASEVARNFQRRGADAAIPRRNHIGRSRVRRM